MDEQADERTICFVCGKDAVDKYFDASDSPTCWEHCGSTGNGRHERDPRSVSIVDGTSYGHGRLLFDISCAQCGQSGSFAVDVPDDDSGGISWG
jgi:hypothetical protein